MKHFIFPGIGFGLLACLVACDSESTQVACVAQVQITAQAGAVQSDGSVMIYGGVVSAPLVGGAGGDAGTYESTVRAVYVALVQAQMGTDQFNFRSFSVQVPADRITAYDDGTGKAKLPVTAYLYGGCVAHLAVDSEPELPVRLDADGGKGGAGATTSTATSTGTGGKDGG